MSRQPETLVERKWMPDLNKLRNLFRSSKSVSASQNMPNYFATGRTPEQR
jgi:hypothetical protein